MGSLLYHPVLNRLARTALRPLAPMLPETWQFPVHGLVRVHLDADADFLLHGHPSSYITKRVFWGGAEAFEAHVMKVLRPLFATSDVFVDVGANVGYYALAASVIQPRLEIVAFEPHPAVYRCLRANVSVNQAANVTPVPLALSDTEGEADLFVPVSRKYGKLDEQLPSTSSFDAAQADQRDSVERTAVRTTTLDAYKARSGLRRIDLLKIDVEGAEPLVLAGAAGVLREDRPVMCCEVLPGRAEAAIRERIETHDYRALQITIEGLVPVRSLAHDGSISNDFLMVPAEREETILEMIGPYGI